MMTKPALPLFYSELSECTVDAKGGELVDEEIAYINHVAQMHDELVEALRAYMDAIRGAQDKQALMAAIRDADDKARAVLAKIDDPENVADRFAAAQAFARDC